MTRRDAAPATRPRRARRAGRRHARRAGDAGTAAAARRLRRRRVAAACSRTGSPQATTPPAGDADARHGLAQTPALQASDDDRAEQFTGHPVSLDFEGVDLRAVLRTFAEITGLNIVIDPAVQGTVDVALRDVPWDQALDIILRANQLGYVGGRDHRAHRPADGALATKEGTKRKLARGARAVRRTAGR